MEASEMFQVAWSNVRPYCWVVSTDGRNTWLKVTADNDEDQITKCDFMVSEETWATNGQRNTR